MLCDEAEHFNNLDEEEEVVKFPRFNSSNSLFYLCPILLFINSKKHILIIICFNVHSNIGTIGARSGRIQQI